MKIRITSRYKLYRKISASDLVLIAVTPNWKDIVSFRGLKQVLRVAFNWGLDMKNNPFCMAKFLYQSGVEGVNIGSEMKSGDFSWLHTLKQLLVGVDKSEL